MFHSFRLKIGLLSLCLSGLLLFGFGLFAVSALNRVGRERVDSELRALADSQVRKIQPADHWRRFDESLRSIYGNDVSKQLIVKATLLGGNILHATVAWPAELQSNSLPLSLSTAKEEVLDRPPPNGDMPPPGKEDDRSPRPSQRPPPPPADDRPPSPRGDQPPRPAPAHQMRIVGPVYATIGGPSTEWRAMTIANEEVTLSIAMNLSGLDAEASRFKKALLVAVPIGLLLLVCGGWLISHVALRPINLIARTVESVTAHRLDERISDETADDEFKRLIALINGMLERLERSFQQATRFSADAAHELKTPLAILQAQTERCLQLAPDGSPEQREYAEQLDEVQRLKLILGKLLLLSQADSGKLPVSPVRINLADMVRSAAEDVRMLAPDRKTTVSAPRELILMADAHLLTQVFQNLISNAVKFGDKGGSIEMALCERAGQALFTISNTGLTIPESDHDKVFDRFYRADKSRSHEIEGSGLGLSLAREIARAHNGELALECSEGNITRFALNLPLC